MNVLFYTDTADYGGHDILTIQAAEYLAQACCLDVGFVFYIENVRLASELRQISNRCERFRLHPINFSSGRLQGMRSFISPRLRTLRNLFRAINPDIVVVSQGRVETSSLGLLAARISGIRTISYIPMAHHANVFGKGLSAQVREIINRRLYSLPDKIITISDAQKNMLQERGATCNIEVVHNGIEVVRAVVTREEARHRLGLARASYIVGVVGRIQFNQKAQDLVVKALQLFSSRLGDVTLCFVGSGPDQRHLDVLIKQLPVSDKALIIPWLREPQEVYAALDMLLIPSRFEGVPLVMLEAMAYGLPIVASDVDGMREFLPTSWLFPSGNEEELVNTLQRVRLGNNASILEGNRRRVLTEFTKARFQRSFAGAITGRTAVPC